MKERILKIGIVLLAISVLIGVSPLPIIFHNYTLKYDEYVYLGGDNIVIGYKTSSDPNAATADNEYATIGTLTYIDRNMKYGAVAHEIGVDKIESGNIYHTPVDSVIKSNSKKIGEKNVDVSYNRETGNIITINKTGVYGIYNSALSNKKLIKLAMPSEIKRGVAYIYTVVDNEKIEAYEIEITKVYYGRKSHNICFKIKDEQLLAKTGGVIKGMSGSPIVQDGKIIGAISHVEDSDPTYGYGLFITYMI